MNFLKFNFGIEETLTPIDGRNRHKLRSLIPFFSELALDKYRVLVELRYFEFLSKRGVIRKLTKSELVSIYRLIDTFGNEEYKEIRKIEKETNHDLKAIEEFIKRKLKSSFRDVVEMVHFGLTSDDVNNIAWALIVRDSLKNVIFPEIKKISEALRNSAQSYRSIPMLSRTHGQPAAPTTVAKEFLVYYKRLDEEFTQLKILKIKAKLTGNVGNLNVHKFIYPKINWLKFSQEFIRSLGLEPDLVTTQIEPYDCYIRLFGNIARINNILSGLCQDFWIYLLLGYFKQKVIQKEVGSTALPHKVNPIYFEGAEGGFGIANALFEFYIRKLSYSRLQRDLSDSTVKRSWGIAFSYSLLSYQSIVVALKRIEPDTKKLKEDLENHWEVLSEVIQNFLRTKGYRNAYEKVKNIFRGKTMTQKDIFQCFKTLKLKEKDIKTLLSLTPEKYIGYAEELVEKYAK